MKKMLFVLGLMISVVGWGQAPAIQWQKCLGGTKGDIANSMGICNDKGYIAAGYTNSNNFNVTINKGKSDGWLVKLDSNGMLQWQKSYGGTLNEGFSSVSQTFDNGFILAGYTYSNDGDISGHHGVVGSNSDYWIVKTNSTGQIEWQKILGGNADDVAMQIQQTSDSGYIVAGYSNSVDFDVTGYIGQYDYWIVKLNKLGTVIWQKSYGGSKDDNCYSIKQTYDKGYILCGQSDSDDFDVYNHKSNALYGTHSDYWVLKIDSIGNIIWSNCYGGSWKDAAQEIIQTKDSGYIISGYSASNDYDLFNSHSGVVGDVDYWVVKLNNTGNIQWGKCYGGSDQDWGQAIKQTLDGGYIVIGDSKSTNGNVSNNHGISDMWLLKISSTGNIEWQNCYGGSTIESSGDCVIQTNDNGYIFAATTYSNNFDVSGNHGDNDFWIAKLSPPPLPLKLLSFNAKLQTQNSVILNWQTTNEVNVSHFNIQRSNNGKDFTSIGKVNASCCSYEFTDGQLLTVNCQLYYRLEMVDKDGSKTYSEIRNVELGIRNKAISVYPNPATAIVTIECAGAKELLIIDNLGRTIYRSTVNSQPLTVNTKQLTKGIYLVRAMLNSGDIKTEKLVVE